ncbi:hypothetical protein BS17DRAFT_362347 [Gyrodon lividus]|nr:hypothetical protein BS17DRAFT_362347 [Gyrodon lividus]
MLQKSRSQQWSNLNKSLLHVAYLEQLGVRYDLSDELAQLDNRTDDGPIGYEQVIDGYPNHMLRPPYKNLAGVDQDLQQNRQLHWPSPWKTQLGGETLPASTFVLSREAQDSKRW